jgi:hypothetical protein
MAAARARVAHAAPAVAPVATPGFWARARAWFAPVVRHPALASGAAVVLIGGLAGVLYLKAGVGTDRDVSGGVAIEEAPRTPDELAPTPSPGAQAGSGQDMSITLDDGLAQPAAPPEPVAEKRAVPRPNRPALRPPSDRTGDDFAEEGDLPRLGAGGGVKSDLEVTGVGRGGRYTNEPSSVGVADPSKSPDLAAPEPAAPNKQRPTTAKDPAPTPAAPSPPPADVPALAIADDEDRDAAESIDTPTTKGSDDKADAPTKPRGPSLEQLTRQARTAARAGDCGVVKTLARKVRSASADYYKRSFASDADIKKCL